MSIKIDYKKGAGARSKEQGARGKGQGARSKEYGSKETWKPTSNEARKKVTDQQEVVC